MNCKEAQDALLDSLAGSTGAMALEDHLANCQNCREFAEIQTSLDARLIYLMDHPDSTEEIPVVDMGPYRAGEPGADRRLAAELRHVTETVGFFYLKNHGVPQSLIDRTFAEGRRFLASSIACRRPSTSRSKGMSACASLRIRDSMAGRSDSEIALVKAKS